MARTTPVRWDKHAITAEVRRRGSTLTEIAVKTGLHPSACRTAVVRRHIAGEKAIADYLGVAPEVLWPKRYAKPSPWAKRKLEEASRTSQNGDAHADMGAAA